MTFIFSPLPKLTGHGEMKLFLSRLLNLCSITTTTVVILKVSQPDFSVNNLSLLHINNTHTHTYSSDSHVELLWPQGDPDEAAREVSLLLFQQVLALVQHDVEHSRSLDGLPGRLKLQGHLQLADSEVVAKVVRDGGDGTERVSGDGAVELGHAGWIQLPAHQLQVAQVPEAVRGVTKCQAGLTAGCGRGAAMVVGCHSLYRRVQMDQENYAPKINSLLIYCGKTNEFLQMYVCSMCIIFAI